MNPRFRARIESLIWDAMRIYNEAKKERHPGLVGLAREIAIEMLFRPLLPKTIGIGSGKIIDSYGGESRQMDIILHHTDILPAAMFGDRLGLFPVESCLYAIEVKSTATAPNARKACEVANSICNLKPRPGFYPCLKSLPDGTTFLDTGIEGAGRYPNFGYFAFSSDLSSSGNESREIDRFLEYLGDKSHHAIHLVIICVAGSITSSWSRQKQQWRHVPHSDKYDEIIYFLSSILNTVTKMLITRTPPNIGSYLWD
ncbi:DUF6602 domain-containing protein [Desulfobacca acetoxidans]